MSNKHDWDRDGVTAPFFKVTKYDRSGGGDGHSIVDNPSGSGHLIQGYRPYYVDASDSMANKGFYVSFQHAPSNEDVNFKAFITAYNESYNCDWAAETVYGRADPIYMFKQNTRDITLALNIPAATVGEAFENLNKVQRLVQFLYPTYDAYTSFSTDALTLTNSPLVRLRVMNLLSAQPDGAAGFIARGTDASSNMSDFLPGGGTTMGHGGLLGVIKNLAINHNLDNPDHGVFETAHGKILPKMIDINISFAAIHEHPVGWLRDEEGYGQNFSAALFPYGTVGDSPNPGADRSMDFSAVARLNEEFHDRIESRIDDMNDEDELTEQQRMQAEARYAGMFGKRRARKDAGEDGRAASAQSRAAASRAKANDTDRSDRSRARHAARADRRQDRADYLQGTIAGGEALYGEDWID